MIEREGIDFGVSSGVDAGLGSERSRCESRARPVRETKRDQQTAVWGDL